MSVALYWFRRDLRLDDHRGLTAALARFESVIPVFVLDPALLSRPDIAKARVRFLFEGLADLDAQLRARGGRLIVRSGDPAQVLPALARETGASVVFHADEIEPHGRERDAKVYQALREIGVSVETHEDLFLVRPDAVRTQAGGVYTVFTPYFRTWSVQPVPTCLPKPARVAVPDEPFRATHSRRPILPGRQRAFGEASRKGSVYSNDSCRARRKRTFPVESYWPMQEPARFPRT